MDSRAYTETVRDVPPPLLYKYRSLDRGSVMPGGARTPCTWDRDIIVGNKLWAGSPLAFNDPFDCHPFIDTSGTTQEIQRWARKQGKRQAQHMSRADRRLFVRTLMTDRSTFRGGEMTDRKAAAGWRDTAANLGVVSLTETPADILMWSYYADSHRGYCLEFATADTSLMLANRVMYQEDRPVFRPLDKDRSGLIEKVLLHKAASWRHEREWRIARSGKVGALSFPAEALKAIVLGANVSAADESALRCLAAESASTIVFRRAVVDHRSYDLSIYEA